MNEVPLKTIGPGTATLVTSLVVAIFSLTGAGCASNRALVASQTARIDSLEASNSALSRLVAQYADSIAFYDFIDSGGFAEQIRFKDGEINRLEYTLAVCRDGGSPVAVELVDDLFEPASARLTKNGENRLDTLADTVRHYIDTGLINIEGHSDSTKPVGELARRYPTNWELSAARAAAIARYFSDHHELDMSLFRIVAFGSAQPVAPNNTARGRRLNRRIRITYVPREGN